MYQLEFVLEYQGAEPTDILYSLDKCCSIIGIEATDYSQAHEVISIEAGGNLQLSGNIFVEIGGGEIAKNKLNVLYIKSLPIQFERLETLVISLIQELPVIQAFIHNHEYCYWQNAEDILEYESADKDHSKLPKISNGLPFPLEQEIINISNNPGRRIFRHGFKEVVSSPMWLKPELVCNIEQLQNITGCTITKVGSLYQICSKHRPFTTSTGEQKYIQDELRNAIYET